jgi:hypothetical protein
MENPAKKAAASRRRSARHHVPEAVVRGQFIDIHRGDLLNLTPESMAGLTGDFGQFGMSGGSGEASFKKARVFHRTNALVRIFALTRRMFLNFGFQLRPAKAGDRDKLAAWQADQTRAALKTRRAIKKFVNDAWLEYVIQDVAVGFWMAEAKTQPTLLAPEDIEFKDWFGIERIRLLNPPQPEELQRAGLSAAMVAKFKDQTHKEYWLEEKRDEYFAVVKRERTGHGLGRPRLEAFFQALAQFESMEAGEALYALLGRTVIRQHKLGHEIKGGPRAGMSSHFANAKRIEAVKNFFRNKKGFLENAGNFDHEIVTHWIDPKNYDATKWVTVVERLRWWGGAAVFLYLAETLRPYLLKLLEVECADDREQMREWFEEVLNSAFELPCPVKVAWKNTCFREPRVADEMLKFLTTQGGASVTTALEESGYDAAEERARKQEELAIEQAQPGTFKPIYDGAHGEVGGGSTGGRPPGTANPDDA